jgi:hypothetical protein
MPLGGPTFIHKTPGKEKSRTEWGGTDVVNKPFACDHQVNPVRRADNAFAQANQICL